MPGMKETMHEYKHHQLHSGSKKGPLVKSREQAIAIGMNEERHNSSPDETRESGDDLVLIGDGGGPFQRYGPLPGEPDADVAMHNQRWEFSFDVPDKIERTRGPFKKQIVDNGGNT